MNITLKNNHKSLKDGISFTLPKFTVLTGKNGSGKSHLLEAIETNGAEVKDDQGAVLKNIKYIPFNGLNPKIKESVTSDDVKNKWHSDWSILSRELNNYRHQSSFQAFISRKTGKAKKLLQHWYDKANGDVDKLTEAFFYENYDVSSDDVFTSQIGEIFKLYQNRLDENLVLIHHKKGLSNSDFENKYGRCPWDVINEMMSIAHLPYKINSPEPAQRDVTFKLLLRNEEKNLDINVNDLSTGEKVLMSLALSIYSTEELNARPDILLIDEPDAALHPEFSNYLISALKESIVDRSHVNVVITTHSPTTVALAPEDSIYVMNKEKGLPEKTTKERAVGILTNDLDNVRVHFDDRRQVFVESNYDVRYYSKIYELLKTNNIDLRRTPIFLPARSGEGSNCEDVKSMVNSMRKAGNDLVFGIIDYDNKNEGNEYVLVAGNGKRYSIENYILDPLYIALLLIREHIEVDKTSIIDSFSFTKIRDLDFEQKQSLIDYVTKSLGFTSENLKECEVINGEKYMIPQDYLTKKGHELENMILEKWEKLKGICAKGRGDAVLKTYILDNVIAEYPEYISKDILDSLLKIE